jgi:hypothetical protein
MLAAAVSGFFAHRQAKAAAQQARAAIEAVEEMRAPKLLGEIVYQAPPNHRLDLYLDSPRPLLAVQAKIVSGEGVSFLGSEESPDTTNISRFEAGTSVSRDVHVEQNHSETITLLMSSTGEPPVLVHVPVFTKWLEEREPEFRIEIDKHEPPRHILRFQLASWWPLASITITIVEGYGVKFVDSAQQEGRKIKIEKPLTKGGEHKLRITVDERYSPTIGIDIECVGTNQERWPPVHQTVLLGFGLGGSPQPPRPRQRR